MGKNKQQLPLHQQQIDGVGGSSSGFFCQGCSLAISKMCKAFNFKCFVVLILSLSVLFSAITWGLSNHSTKSGFDADPSIKKSVSMCGRERVDMDFDLVRGKLIKSNAAIWASFRLQKPVSVLVPLISKLEYDINEEIGLPTTKVVILSLQPAPVLNSTNVIFGFLSDPMNATINKFYLSVLKSSLLGIFLQQFNLTLTDSTFGQPSMFEILKFPGGITVIPDQDAFFWKTPVDFNFTLRNSVYEMVQSFDDLKEQLTFDLQLTPDETLNLQVSNDFGSTAKPPVTVQVSVTSDKGIVLPKRLKQLAQTIRGSSSKNLGLDHSVFGKVKQISLSSYLTDPLHASPPTPSPAPSPVETEHAEPSYPPDNFPSHAPSPTPISHSPAPAPAPVHIRSPHPSPHCGSEITPNPLARSPSSSLPPSPMSPSPSDPFPPSPRSPVNSVGLSPLPVVSYSSTPGKEKRKGKSFAASSSYVTTPSPLKNWMFVIIVLLTLQQLGWT